MAISGSRVVVSVSVVCPGDRLAARELRLAALPSPTREHRLTPEKIEIQNTASAWMGLTFTPSESLKILN